MTGSPSAIITLGLGPADYSGVNLVVTLGLGAYFTPTSSGPPVGTLGLMGVGA